MNSVKIPVLIARLRPSSSVLGFGPIRTGIAWRKFEYRNLAQVPLNNKKILDEFHKKIRKQVDELKVYNVVAKDFTAWIKAIQKATIVELGAKDPWTDNKGLIQVRRIVRGEL